METVQVRLRLTEDKEVLKQLESNNALHTDKKTKRKSYKIQFNGLVFTFFPGEPKVFDRSVAESLRRSSGLVIGDHLTGDVGYALEQLGSYDLLTTGGQKSHRANASTCTICAIEFDTVPQMLSHMKSHQKDHPELFVTAEEAEKLDQRPVDELGNKVSVNPIVSN